MRAVVPVLALLLCTGVAYAEIPGHYPGVAIQDGAGPLYVYSSAAPVVVDWNNDGKKDLIVGEGEGELYLYLNQNTDEAPLFNGSTKIQSNGVPIKVSQYEGG